MEQMLFLRHIIHRVTIKGRIRMRKDKGGSDENQSFIVEIKNKEHHTWQGAVTWVEGKKKENFRSALELLKLMDSTFKSSMEET